MHIKKLFSPSDNVESSNIPEKALLFQIIHTAILDASSSGVDLVAWEAIDFLFTNRVNRYVELLNVDPDLFKFGLIKMMRLNRHKAAKRGDVNVRKFIINYDKYHNKPFYPSIPLDLIYSSRNILTNN